LAYVDKRAHASMTDTFIISNSLRVHSFRLPNIAAKRRGCQPIKWEQYWYARGFIFFAAKFELPRNGRMPTNQIRAVHAPAYALPPKFEHFTAHWRGCLY